MAFNTGNPLRADVKSALINLHQYKSETDMREIAVLRFLCIAVNEVNGNFIGYRNKRLTNEIIYIIVLI